MPCYQRTEFQHWHYINRYTWLPHWFQCGIWSEHFFWEQCLYPYSCILWLNFAMSMTLVFLMLHQLWMGLCHDEWFVRSPSKFFSETNVLLWLLTSFKLGFERSNLPGQHTFSLKSYGDVHSTSIRPSEFSGRFSTCFGLSIWNLEYTFGWWCDILCDSWQSGRLDLYLSDKQKLRFSFVFIAL